MKWGICRQNLSIDETIVPYFGRSSLKQFIRGKPVRFKFKMWCLADDSGYCYQTELYTGRDHLRIGALGPRVVLSLVDKCVQHPEAQTLTFDNCFTSISLLSDLRLKGLRARGTIRKNRIGSVPLQSEREVKNLIVAFMIVTSIRPNK